MTLAAVLVLLFVHNLGANLWVDDRWYVPVNLLTTAALLGLVGTAGVGLTWGRAPLLGVGAALLVLGAICVLVRLRPGLFADRRMAGVDARGTAGRALVRIPLGTVVLEEVAFRGVLPALLSPVAASVLFGLWHVVPTAKTLDINGLARAPRTRTLAVAAAVGATTVVGLVLCALRSATGSLLAPALVHAAANGGAVVAGYRVLRSAAGAEAPADPLPHPAPDQAVEDPS